MLPAQGPAVQERKRWPAAVEAVSTTWVPSRKEAAWEAQAGSQEMAAGLERTVPAPLPDLVTVSVRRRPTWSESTATLLAGVLSVTPPGVVAVAWSEMEDEPEPDATAAVMA